MVLSGAYNLGDELILRSEIDFFKNKYPESNFIIATYNKDSFIGSCENCQFISFFPNNLKKFFFKNIIYFFQTIYVIFKSDLVIIGGGGIFFDNEPWVSFRKNLFEWQLRLFFARLFRKKVIFLWFSIEVKNEKNQEKLVKIFRSTDVIFPRDGRSVEILKKFNIFAEELYDSVFLIPSYSKKWKKLPKKIGISLRGGFLSQEEWEELKKFIRFLDEKNFEIIFISHSFFGKKEHNDIKIVEHYFGNVYKITTTMEETMKMYEELDMVIAMRFHSVLLSAQHGIPVLIIPYGPKIQSLSQNLQWQDFVIDMNSFTSEQFQEKFLYIYNDFENMQEKISQRYREVHKNFLQKMNKIDII